MTTQDQTLPSGVLLCYMSPVLRLALACYYRRTMMLPTGWRGRRSSTRQPAVSLCSPNQPIFVYLSFVWYAMVVYWNNPQKHLISQYRPIGLQWWLLGCVEFVWRYFVKPGLLKRRGAIGRFGFFNKLAVRSILHKWRTWCNTEVCIFLLSWCDRREMYQTNCHHLLKNWIQWHYWLRARSRHDTIGP